MMDQQLIGKHILAHGKDGIWKDTEITFMFKVLSFNIFIGSAQAQSYSNLMEEPVHMLSSIGRKSIGSGIGDLNPKVFSDLYTFIFIKANNNFFIKIFV